ncbi:MAG: MFS transporter [Proteobacteria bacterium]|nr:MFS transporter [Pseudomonadota bacterium]
MPDSRTPLPLPLRRLGLLFLLYFVQGLPFGFQGATLPVYLREAGVSLTAISLAGAVALPWTAKVLWAPVVDRFYWPAVGRRRSWILPLQLALAATCALAGFAEPDGSLIPLLTLALFMNLFAATMDVAVDGLAVDTLEPPHLGYGNIAQVVGYKLGMITAGGILLAVSDAITWTGMFAIMTALVSLGAIAMLFFTETETEAGGRTSAAPATFGKIMAILAIALRAPSARWLLLFIATYKLGETVADVLFRPFLVDVGFSKEQIGLWVGTYGMVASIIGSFTGGIIASQVGILTAVGITAVLRVVPIFGEWWLTWSAPSAEAVISVTMAEHFFGGALTTAMFAFMMSQVDRRIGATHFTVFATIEVLGKMAAGALSGLIADATSYPFAYGLATLLSAAYLALLIPITRIAGDRSNSTPPAPSAPS